MADTGRLDELKRKFEGNPRRYFAPLANEYRKAGDPELAIELCRTYLPKQPTHMSGYIVYGQALQDAGHMDESEAVFKQALTLDPENIIALRNLGDIARNAGDSAAATHWYAKVLELDPRNEEVTAYVAALVQRGSAATAPVSERPAPPAIRPEPEPDPSAIRLEDIVSQPDVAQTPFAIDGGGLADEPLDEPLDVSDWPTASEPDELDRDLDGEFDRVAPDTMTDAEADHAAQGPWHSPRVEEPEDNPADSVADLTSASVAQDETEGHEEPVEPPHITDFMPDERVEFVPPPGDRPIDSDAEHVPAESPPLPVMPGIEESPFVTETMAELYMQQGLRGEALGIYRQLALKRDDARLRQRIAEIESQQAVAPKGETVRAFFARIGSVRPAAAVEPAPGKDDGHDRNSPLSALFGSAQPDAGDLGAAERLAGAFDDRRSGNSRS